MQALASVAARDRETVRDMLELLAKPQPRLTDFLVRRGYVDPNFRMAQLLNESEDLRAARKQLQQFWMNNQPSVLTYERLSGAIGP